MDEESRLKLIDQQLWRWAEWRHAQRGRGALLGYKRNFLSKCLDGLRSTACPTCRGRGWVHHITPKGKQKTPCPLCRGEGRINPKGTRSKINPAFVPSSNPSPVVNEDMERIEDAVVSLPEGPRAVILEHYAGPPWKTAKQKAKALSLRYESYLFHLREGRRLVAGWVSRGLTGT